MTEQMVYGVGFTITQCRFKGGTNSRNARGRNGRGRPRGSRTAEIIGKFKSDFSDKGLTQEEIMNKTGESQPTISRIIQDSKNGILNKPIVPESLQSGREL